MPATPLRVEITAEDIANLGKDRNRDYDYNDIEVPGDYAATLVDVNDFTSRAGNAGWKFTYEVLGCPFDEYVMHSVKWKLIQVMEAHGFPIEEGVEEFDPTAYIGTEVGTRIDWQHDPDTLDEGTANYREIKEVFKLPDEETEELDPLAEDDVAAL